MKWSELLRAEIESNFKTTDSLMERLNDSDLEWKPASGSNWMTTGQLLMHHGNSCGMPMRGFATGDWGLPEGVSWEDIPPEEMMPAAEEMPSVKSVAEGRELLTDDQKIALEILDACPEERLETEPAPAPWDPTPLSLGHRMLNMVTHLKQHKGQLFYYLKLQGKDMNTQDLWSA